MKATISAKTLIATQWTDFYGWSKGEYVWLGIATAAILTISFALGSTPIEVISSITGIIGAILVAKAKLSSYVWGAIATGTYAWVSYVYQLYGEAILYTMLFLPMQFIGYYIWLKAARRGSQEDVVDVEKRLLTAKQRVGVAIVTAMVIVAYASLIGMLRGATPGLDSATAILSVVATTLMMLRYGEQWIVWIMVNSVAIVMWVIMVIEHETQGWAVLAMWILFLLNSVYGWWKWRKAAFAN